MVAMEFRSGDLVDQLLAGWQTLGFYGIEAGCLDGWQTLGFYGHLEAVR
jgi:hypothetical protein